MKKEEVKQEAKKKHGKDFSNDPKKLKKIKLELEQDLRERNEADRHGSTGQFGPLLVHCSAGVGRTGTFIAIDMLMDRLRWFGLNTEIDVYSTVQHIRNYRMSMV